MPTPTMPAPPTTVPSSIAPPTVVPNPAMIQVPGTQPIPVPGSIPMPPGVAVPPAPGPQRYMTPKAQGATYEQMIGQGWTDALLQQHGMMVVQ